VAAAIGYVIFIGLGGWPGLAEPGLAIPALPPYTSTSVLDLVLGVVVGVVTAVLVAAVRRGARTLSVEGGARVRCPSCSSVAAWPSASRTGRGLAGR
jgi:hypothetical protein